MLELPKKTEVNKRIPKQKLYENADINASLKRTIIEQVKVIYWKNKIATSTTNLAEGSNVTELEVFEIQLNNPTLDTNVLCQIDRKIPYHILFLLEYDGMYQAWLGYKELQVTSKVNNYYHTDWLTTNAMKLRLEGLSLDDVYENFLRQIAGEKLKRKTEAETIKESVLKDEQKQGFIRQIEALKKEIKKEVQLNKQMDLNTELKKLKKQLEAL